MVDVLDPILGPLDGAKIPGGCDECDAYQMPQKVSAYFWLIEVYHDDDCGVLRQLAGSGRTSE